jgi:hypothetical protein
MKQLRRGKWSLLIYVGIILILTGCTRSISATYNADMTRLSNANALANVSLGVAKFEDKRGWVNADDSKSESYIAMQSPWKFGITYQDKEYTPVKDVIQTIFIKELTNAGINAKPIAQIISKQNINHVRDLSEKDKIDYIIGGQILVFEFVNDTGVWTVGSRRTVTLNLIMVKMNGEEVLLDTNYNETQNENEGMGVLHSTNVDKLMNIVVKKVIKQVIQEVATKMALNYNDVSWKIVFNGKTYDFKPNLT